MKFTTIFNEEIEVPCAGCVVMDETKFKQGRIYQTKLFDISQDFEIALPGMMVISPMRHVSNFADLTDEERAELNVLTIKCKQALSELWSIKQLSYQFYEKPDGHVHFVIIPLWDWFEYKNKYGILAELMEQIPALRKDEKNMQQVVEYINKLKKWFEEN